MISKKILINILLFHYILSNDSIFRLCNLNSYSKKNKIINEINLINIITTIINKNIPMHYQKNCVSKLPVANESDDIFAFLTEKERFFFTLLLKKSKKYLEFGMGGSTLLAYMTPNIEKIISIDSDYNWIQSIKNFKNLKNDEGKRIILNYIDVGKIGKWGFPKKKNSKISNYSKQIFQKYENDYDLVFIDGISRVACALQVILNCKSDIKILIHDFNYRPYYHILYKYLDIIYAIDSFALFSIKDDIDLDEIQKDYEIYKTDIR
jgi:hypothetical protein